MKSKFRQRRDQEELKEGLVGREHKGSSVEVPSPRKSRSYGTQTPSFLAVPETVLWPLSQTWFSLLEKGVFRRRVATAEV